MFGIKLKWPKSEILEYIRETRKEREEKRKKYAGMITWDEYLADKLYIPKERK